VTARRRSTNRFAVGIAILVGLVVPCSGASVSWSGASTRNSAQLEPPAASPCQARQLSVSFSNKRGRFDHSYRVLLVLTNTAAVPCGMFGFMDLRMLEPDGETLVTDVQRADTSRPAAEVVVPPAGQASAQLSWGGLESSEPCVAPTGLEITPPGDTQFLVAIWPVSRSLVCRYGELDIEPIRRVST
jgi:Protein of unknown function (DUF4232)